MKILILLASCITLSACTLSPTGTMTGSSNRYETHSDIMNAWVGKPEKDLIAHWGEPSEIKQSSSASRIIVYHAQNPYILMGCTSVFELEQGKVTKWGYKGCPIRENKKDYKLVPKNTPVPQQTLDVFNL